MHVNPPEPQQLAFSQAAMQCEPVEGLEAIPDLVRRGYEVAGLTQRERMDLRFLRRGGTDRAGGTAKTL